MQFQIQNRWPENSPGTHTNQGRQPPISRRQGSELHAAGRLPIDRLITGRYRLAQINEACHEMLNGVAGRGVVVF